MRVHCELFPGCMEIGENSAIPTCFKSKCPGRVRKEFSEAFARALTQTPRPLDTPEENLIEEMRAYLWAAGIGAGDAECAARQLYHQGFLIVKANKPVTPASIEELDRLLNSEDDQPIKINPDGSISPLGSGGSLVGRVVAGDGLKAR